MFQIFKSPPKPDRKVVLLTGAAGSIGTSLRYELGSEYHFRCLDRIRVRDAQDVRVADINNFKADVYTSGIGGTYNVFEAARQAGVKQIVYASTNHVSGWREIEGSPLIEPDQLIRPDSLYAVGKAFGEALGQFFVDRYDLSIVCLRIGWFKTEPKLYIPNDPLLATYCSPRDLAQLVKRSLDRPDLGFQIFYAISGNTRRYWDISNAQLLLGYEPQDNAEDLLAND
jgi:uronate dehydrogenase